MMTIIEGGALDIMAYSYTEHEDVLFYPFVTSANAVMDNIKDGIRNQGFNLISLEEWRENPHACNVILNWFEEFHGTSQLRGLMQYAKKTALLKMFVKKNCSIITLVHNKIPHDRARPWIAGYTLSMRRRLFSVADHIVVLSDTTIDVVNSQMSGNMREFVSNKITKIPLPNYQGHLEVEKGFSIRGECGIPGQDFVALFFGQIRKYKNIELIIETAKTFAAAGKDDIHFVVAGICPDPGYLEELSQAVEGMNNLSFVPGFLEERRLNSMISDSDLMILPYNKESSLNSSSCYLAFSLGKTVVCPEIGTVGEFPPGLIFSYDYASDSEHLDRFTDAVERAYQEWCENRAAFMARGERLQQIVFSQCSVNAVGAEYARILR